jgi:hypothetical protein
MARFEGAGGLLIEKPGQKTDRINLLKSAMYLLFIYLQLLRVILVQKRQSL